MLHTLCLNCLWWQCVPWCVGSFSLPHHSSDFDPLRQPTWLLQLIVFAATNCDPHISTCCTQILCSAQYQPQQRRQLSPAFIIDRALINVIWNGQCGIKRSIVRHLQTHFNYCINRRFGWITIPRHLIDIQLNRWTLGEHFKRHLIPYSSRISVLWLLQIHHRTTSIVTHD